MCEGVEVNWRGKMHCQAPRMRLAACEARTPARSRGYGVVLPTSYSQFPRPATAPTRRCDRTHKLLNSAKHHKTTTKLTFYKATSISHINQDSPRPALRPHSQTQTPQPCAQHQTRVDFSHGPLPEPPPGGEVSAHSSIARRLHMNLS